MRQGVFDLHVEPHYGRDDFLVSDGNRAAFDLIADWPNWPGPALALYGPAGSGKTHLAHLWCERSGAPLLAGGMLDKPEALPATVAIDDVERAPERALLHLYNLCREQNGGMLLTMRAAPASLTIGLPDLASRLRALPVIGIAEPDDALLHAVLVKHFADRQLRVTPEVFAYLLARIERSFAAAAATVARLDQLALETGRPVTVNLARAVLAEADQSSPPRDLTVT
jgi:chromosomal replication initiation ATPase DnaA